MLRSVSGSIPLPKPRPWREPRGDRERGNPEDPQGSWGWRITALALSTFAGLSLVTFRFDLSTNCRNETGHIDEVRIVWTN